MNIEEIMDAHRRFGTTDEQIVERAGYMQLLEFVVVAPWWSHTTFQDYAKKIEKVSERVYNVYGEDFKFSFIEIRNIGAPAMLEMLLPMYLTKCKQMLFIGSVGSLVEDIKIGDLVVPKCSLNGVGACRFLNTNLADDFEQETYPDLEFNSKIISIIKNSFPQFKVYETINYSVDTIFAQYAHINRFIELKCETIEMETSAFFKCANIIKIPSAALLCVSDNTLKNKSLYSVRTDNERSLKKEMQNKNVPQIVVEICKST